MVDAVVDARPMSRMEAGDYFILGIICLQFGAVASYIWRRRWHEAVVYGAYMTAQIALLLLSLRGRK